MITNIITQICKLFHNVLLSYIKEVIFFDMSGERLLNGRQCEGL